ncbi:DUF805 domain-containing protein [Hoeflea sp. TYP-13]|uniref:DUF805 domain-containing protein n=1 Tax=Hoeflea sp. TYP-13 TaxID=3230023 RepID=UPI0034C6DB6D
MTFLESVQTVFSKYAVFSGRATRPEYWWWVLFNVIVSVVTDIIDGAIIAPLLGFGMYSSDAADPLGWISALVLLVPSIAVSARRLHDIGRSGWWLLLMFLPIIGWLILLYWHIQPTAPGQNEYG